MAVFEFRYTSLKMFVFCDVKGRVVRDQKTKQNKKPFFLIWTGAYYFAYFGLNAICSETCQSPYFT